MLTRCSKTVPFIIFRKNINSNNNKKHEREKNGKSNSCAKQRVSERFVFLISLIPNMFFLILSPAFVSICNPIKPEEIYISFAILNSSFNSLSNVLFTIQNCQHIKCNKTMFQNILHLILILTHAAQSYILLLLLIIIILIIICFPYKETEAKKQTKYSVGFLFVMS